MSELLEDTLVQSDLQRDQSRELSLRADRPPLSIKGYTFVRRLGTGAFGSVWLAREDNTGKNVAIKFYTHRRGLDWSLLNREVEKLAVLYTSRNVVGLLDVGWNSDPPYYAMEYLENGSLASMLENGPLDADEAVRVAIGIAKGLVHAHGSGILHCDLKPANVLFDGEMEPRLCDFGQSRLSSEQNPALGTLFYMAPEQADLRAVPDARWDVYALGTLLYQMITGSPPFRTAAAEERIRQAPSLAERLAAYRDLINGSSAPDAHRKVPGVDSRLIEITDRCLAIDAADRFPNAQAVLERLEARERQRQRAPLLRLGVLGPLLLLAAMAPLFIYIINRNVKTLETELTERALESDALTARVQARSLEDELNHRIAELEDVSINPELIAELQAATRRPGEEVELEYRQAVNDPERVPARWISLLDKAYNRVRLRAENRNGSLDTSWFFTSADGVQLWRRGVGKWQNSIGKHFWYRDYYHGGGDNLPHEPGGHQPRPENVTMFEGENHVSVAFISTATDRYMVAITVKVRGEPDQEGNRPVIGLLGRTIHLDEFRGRFINRIQGQQTRKDQVDREIVLVDARNDYRMLDHSWIADIVRAGDHRDDEKENFSDAFRAEARTVFDPSAPHEFYKNLKIPRNIAERLEAQPADSHGHRELRVSDYEDPIGKINVDSTIPYRDNWLAAFYQFEVGKAPWVVIIQERSEKTSDSVNRMSEAAIRYGLLAILTSIIGLLAVWWFVIRTMRNLGREKKSGV